MSWNCLQSGEIYYDRTTRAENEDASWKKKKKCSSLWWTLSGKGKANSDYSNCIMALFQMLERGYPTLWKSMELVTGRVRWNLMRMKTNLWQLLASGNSPLKRNWPGNLPQSGLLKKVTCSLEECNWVCLSHTLHQDKRKNIWLVDDDRL